MGKLCKYANVFGDCKADKTNCNKETSFILNDSYLNEENRNGCR